jgi:hypothetical protein
MSNWIDNYKKLIVSSHKQHVIVADHDNLFEYIELQQCLQDDGYTIIRATTELDVRVQFELEVKDSKQPFIIVTGGSYFPPPDIGIAVHFKAIGLKDLFPFLDTKALHGLSFNALCLLSNIKPYEELSHEKTLKFLLENLYNVDFDTLTSVKHKERILHALITVFLEKNAVNQPLSLFLTRLAKPYFPTLFTTSFDKEILIKYLYSQWSEYIANGSCDVDFEDSILNKNLGFLFIFDYIKKIKVTAERFQALPRPLKVGAYIDDRENNDADLAALLSYLEQQQSCIEDIYKQWFDIVKIMAKAKIKEFGTANVGLKERCKQVTIDLNKRFQRFIDNVYSSLFSLSGVRTPVIISRMLEYIKAQPDKRKALFVLDGMNYWQWCIIECKLRKSGLTIQTKTSMAYIPSITAWSRQSLFSGCNPNLEKTNSNEAKLFEAYWAKFGYSKHQIGFLKFSHNKPLDADAIPANVDILGIVCNDLDDIMHGAVLGNEQLMTATLQWLDASKIVDYINELRIKGFKIFVTTDHGNVEAIGIKNLKLKEKVGSLSRGCRYINFRNEIMLNNFKEQNSELSIGTRNNSVFLKQEDAFTDHDVKIVTHGGSHLWEVLIPFGEIL